MLGRGRLVAFEPNAPPGLNPSMKGRGYWRDDDAMKRPLFAKPIRRAPPPQHAWGMTAPFAMLPEEPIADIRANYAAFRARKLARAPCIGRQKSKPRNRAQENFGRRRPLSRERPSQRARPRIARPHNPAISRQNPACRHRSNSCNINYLNTGWATRIRTERCTHMHRFSPLAVALKSEWTSSA